MADDEELAVAEEAIEEEAIEEEAVEAGATTGDTGGGEAMGEAGEKGNEQEREEGLIDRIVKAGEGINIPKKDLWMIAGGALGALAALRLGALTKAMRPAAVCAVREGYAFKEWLTGHGERLKEDVEDIFAEGVQRYREDLAAAAETVNREKAVLEKIGKVVEDRMARVRPGSEGA